MSGTFVGLLVLLVFIVGADARMGSEQSKLWKSEVALHGLAIDKTIATTQRRLRTEDDVVVSHDEDRVNLPGLSTVSEKVSSSTQYLANKMILALHKDPDDAYKALRLHSTGVTIDNPTFLQWMNHVEKYRTKKGFFSFSDFRVFDLLRKTNSDEELVALFVALRKVPDNKNFAEKMQQFLFESSVPSRKLLNEAWLKSGEKPKDVFTILRLRNTGWEDSAKFLQWLRFVEGYKRKSNVWHSDLQTYNFLMKEHPDELDSTFATLFQWILHTPDLEKVGENLQTYLFRSWIARKEEPSRIGMLLAIPNGNNVLLLPKDDALFKALKAYTIYYAGEKGGQATMKAVADLFAMDRRKEALSAAMKV